MDYDAAARAAQQQGDANEAYYKSQATNYSNDYNNYKGQADTANQNVSNFNDYMKNAGSASNLYNTAFGDQATKAGFNQNTMDQAQANVSQASGAQSAYNDFANTAASKWGMNAGALAASNASAQSSLNNNIAAAGTTLGTQQKAFDQAQNGANQVAGLGVQQQQTQMAGLQNVYNNALSQQKQAYDSMQSYEQLYQQQGGLTAQQVQLFGSTASLLKQADAAVLSARAAMTQAAAAARLNNSQVDIANEKNAYAKANSLGDYAKPAQAAQQQASQAASSPSAGDMWNAFTQPMGQAFGSAGSWIGSLFGAH